MIPLDVEFHGDRYCVSWSDREARYHVWLADNREPQDCIYRNANATRGTRDHKTTHRSLTKRPTLREAIRTLPASMFDEAKRRYDLAQKQYEEQARQNSINLLQENAARLGFKLVPVDAK